MSPYKSCPESSISLSLGFFTRQRGIFFLDDDDEAHCLTHKSSSEWIHTAAFKRTLSEPLNQSVTIRVMCHSNLEILFKSGAIR